MRVAGKRAERFAGLPCENCGSTERYASNRTCVKCAYAAARRHANKVGSSSSPEAQRKWRAENPEKFRAAKRSWAERNPEKNRSCKTTWKKRNPGKKAEYRHRRRALLNGAHGTYSVNEWEAIVLRQKGRCAQCDTKCKLTVDHIVPLAKGGCNFAFNLQGLCGPCNARKHTLLGSGTQFSLFDQTAAA